MDLDADGQTLDARIARAPDLAFRARAATEYRRISRWLEGRIDLDRARILDFGCGRGIAAASFALRHPGATVVGVDVAPVPVTSLDVILRSQLGCDLPRNVSYCTINPGDLPEAEGFDLIYAWSVFGHINEDIIISLFTKIKSKIVKGGLIFIQVNPLYFSPEGSHLYNYFKSPWHHLILSLDQLHEGVFSKDPVYNASREWQQFMELNRLTAQDIIGRASAAGLKRIREQVFKTSLTPPPRLTRVYDPATLLTTEFMALFE